MTECPFIPSNADRLTQSQRPNPLVRYNPAGRTKGTERLRTEEYLRQVRWRNLQTQVFRPRKSASAAAPRPPINALCP